jgi:carbonic anhydrase
MVRPPRPFHLAFDRSLQVTAKDRSCTGPVARDALGRIAKVRFIGGTMPIFCTAMRSKLRHLLVLAAMSSLAIMTACKHDESKKPTDPHYTLPGLDHGLLQSPVNILSSESKDRTHQIVLNVHDAEPNYLQNTGHSIQLDFPRGSSVVFDGEEYQLEQVHFHTPSEHQIDGITFPMEVHVVNMIEPKNRKEPPRYLVLAFFYRMGRENPFIARFLEQVPTEKGSEALNTGRVYVADADENLGTEYYHYSGSLTTPPYTETVHWIIAKKIFQASPEQIRRINLIEGDNARRVQALYGRALEE